jgi:hypothetical protein
LKAPGDAGRQLRLEQPSGGTGRRGGELLVPLTEYVNDGRPRGHHLGNLSIHVIDQTVCRGANVAAGWLAPVASTKKCGDLPEREARSESTVPGTR